MERICNFIRNWSENGTNQKPENRNNLLAEVEQLEKHKLAMLAEQYIYRKKQEEAIDFVLTELNLVVRTFGRGQKKDKIKDLFQKTKEKIKDAVHQRQGKLATIIKLDAWDLNPAPMRA